MSGKRIGLAAFTALSATFPTAACAEAPEPATITFGILCESAPEGSTASVETVYSLGRSVVVQCVDSNGNPLDVIGIGIGTTSKGNSIPGYTALVTITSLEGEDQDTQASFGFQWGKHIASDIAADGAEPPSLEPEQRYGHVRFTGPGFRVSGATIQPAS